MREIKKFIDIISTAYRWSTLPEVMSKHFREMYFENLPDIFKNQEKLEQGESWHVYTLSGQLIAKDYKQIIIGDYGCYVEIADDDMIKENIIVKPGQEFRLSMDFLGKYHWYTDSHKQKIKLYFQTKGVNYADYTVGMWYVSPYDVIIKKQPYED